MAQQQALRAAAGSSSTQSGLAAWRAQPQHEQQQLRLPLLPAGQCIQRLQCTQRSLLSRRALIRHPVAAQALVLSINQPYFADGPFEPSQDNQSSSKQPEKPLVRVRLNVHYRVHSRQMLAIGGSQIPFGWSFLSIAKVPMTWNQGDVWTCEVSHGLTGQPRCAPAGQSVVALLPHSLARVLLLTPPPRPPVCAPALCSCCCRLGSG
jgi:hypothetical protein